MTTQSKSEKPSDFYQRWILNGHTRERAMHEVLLRYLDEQHAASRGERTDGPALAPEEAAWADYRARSTPVVAPPVIDTSEGSYKRTTSEAAPPAQPAAVERDADSAESVSQLIDDARRRTKDLMAAERAGENIGDLGSMVLRSIAPTVEPAVPVAGELDTRVELTADKVRRGFCADASKQYEGLNALMGLLGRLQRGEQQRDAALAQVEELEAKLYEAKACGSSLLAAIREMFTSRGWSDYAVQGVNLSGAVLSCLQSVSANREALIAANESYHRAESLQSECSSLRQELTQERAHAMALRAEVKELERKLKYELDCASYRDGQELDACEELIDVALALETAGIESDDPEAPTLAAVRKLLTDRDAALKSASELAARVKELEGERPLRAGDAVVVLANGAERRCIQSVNEASYRLDGGGVYPSSKLRRVDPPATSEPCAPVATSEMPIVVGSVWHFHADRLHGDACESLSGKRLVDWLDKHTVHTSFLDKSAGTAWDHGAFRELHTWISNPPATPEPGSEGSK